MNKPYIIAIEGHDYSGKTSMAKALTERLIKAGVNAVYLKAPDYSTESGKAIIDYLNGKIKATSPLLMAGLYALNRGDAYRRLLLEHSRVNNLVIVADRCFSSSVCTLPSMDFLNEGGSNVVSNFNRYSTKVKAIEVEAGSFIPNVTLVLHASDDVIAMHMCLRDISESVAEDGSQDIHENMDAVRKTKALYMLHAYRSAHASIDTSEVSVDDVVEHVLEWHSVIDGRFNLSPPRECLFEEEPKGVLKWLK